MCECEQMPQIALQQVKALVIVPLFAGFFDSTVVVADVHAGADNFFAVDVEIKFGRFLQERMLGANRVCGMSNHP